MFRWTLYNHISFCGSLTASVTSCVFSSANSSTSSASSLSASSANGPSKKSSPSSSDWNLFDSFTIFRSARSTRLVWSRVLGFGVSRRSPTSRRKKGRALDCDDPDDRTESKMEGLKGEEVRGAGEDQGATGEDDPSFFYRSLSETMSTIKISKTTYKI